MFDIGFWELVVLGLVALLVVGPERLPKLAYTAGKWLGKGRAMMGAVKAEIDKEIKAEELKRVLDEQKKKLNPLEEVIEETSGAVRDIKREAERAVGDAAPSQGRGLEADRQADDAAAPSQADDQRQRPV